MKFEIVDAYTHCGISKYRPIEDVQAVMNRWNVSRAVLVQHLGEFDNSYLAIVVQRDRRHLAGVCLLDPAAHDADQRLDQIIAEGVFHGVRLSTESLEQSAGFMERVLSAGLIVVLYAPRGVSTYYAKLRAVLEKVPRGKLVITHLGTPDLTHAPIFKPEVEAFRLAEFPGVFLQVSGMKMFCPYPHTELYPLLEQALAHFGGERLLWGSNYPVVGESEDYGQDLQLSLNRLWPLPHGSVEDVCGNNAARLWFGAANP